MSDMRRVVITGTCRTPMAKSGPDSALRDFTAQDLLAHCFKNTLSRAAKDRNVLLDETIAGCVCQSSDAPNIARVAWLKAFPNGILVPGRTVQRNCASGIEAITSAAQAIKAGDANVILAGGAESMTRIPFLLRDMRGGRKYGHSKVVCALEEGLTDPITGEIMWKTAENVAKDYDIGRSDQDIFAVESHKKAFKASREGKFRSQIEPLKNKKGEPVAQDQGPNPAINAPMLAMYPTMHKIFEKKDIGTVTPGNACPTSDGGAACLVMSLDAAREYGIEPEAEVIAYDYSACHPSYMGLGPVYAIPSALKRANIAIDQVDWFEINEAFAAQVLACQRELKIPMEKLNPWGGAIALGHPLGATGMILTAKMVALLKDTQKEYGMISMCVGGGQGGALLLKRWS